MTFRKVLLKVGNLAHIPQQPDATRTVGARGHVLHPGQGLQRFLVLRVALAGQEIVLGPDVQRAFQVADR
jgi:hypothetical protein